MYINITPEIIFQTARSGGKGGQNVNKVETMVEGRWFIARSSLVTESQKCLILSRLATRITKDGALLVKSQYGRSQSGNKQKVIEKMNRLANEALTPRKKRIATQTPEAVKRKRLKDKKIRSALKKDRRKWEDE